MDGDQRRGAPVLLQQESCDGVDVLCASGLVDEEEAESLVTAAREVLSHEPAGVVLDLCDVTSLTGAARDRLVELTSLTGPSRPSLVLCPSGVLPAAPGVATAESRAEAVGKVDRRAAPRTVFDVEHSVYGPAQARAAVNDCAERLGIDDVAEDIVLLVSEMVTNAIRHAAPPVRLELQAQTDDIVVTVRDGSQTPPVPRDADEGAEGGRGMLLVDRLATEHGVRVDPPGKAVWARLRRSTFGS